MREPERGCPSSGRSADRFADHKLARSNAILDIAGEVFLRDGFMGASLNEIASRIGGAKATLYRYFASKELLFAAYVERYCAGLRLETAELIDPTIEPRVALTQFSRALQTVVASERAIAHLRMIAGASDRFPHLGRLLHEVSAGSLAEALADFLRQASALGALHAPDPQMAARQFMSLCVGDLLHERLCGVWSEPTVSESSEAVETFLAIVSPEREPSIA